MCQRRIYAERDLGIETLKCKEIAKLLKVAGLIKTVTELGPCYTKVV